MLLDCIHLIGLENSEAPLAFFDHTLDLLDDLTVAIGDPRDRALVARRRAELALTRGDVNVALACGREAVQLSAHVSPAEHRDHESW